MQIPKESAQSFGGGEGTIAGHRTLFAKVKTAPGIGSGVIISRKDILKSLAQQDTFEVYHDTVENGPHEHIRQQ